ncbi:carbohydrate-binding module family 5 protein [Piloderma croceum F 1598]|uniref:chitinase n=1 Tax=Piloderma croceum (strain F 1598) TaxID=765440 RepID=A0A0C3G078_PILCF|nr:carbohydrate-binding module family 5 protein [Piloderma croceum F 1598]
MHLLTVLISTVCLVQAAAFDNTRYDNLAVYWGQNSYGAVNAGDTANGQKTLSYYCQDNTIDVIPLAFVNVFFGIGGAPSMNLANTCNPTDNATFPSTALPDCSSLASDIKECQSIGKIITLSLGGATGSVGFTDDSQAESFAQTLWDDYFEGSSSTRPFGDAILDGIDLDIESGSSSYATFLSKFRSLSGNASKKYYVSSAPQCVFPDSALGATLNASDFDMVYVQFYNNPCGLQHFNTSSDWDFGLWDNWARQTSINKDVKIYVGAPASSSAAGSGYQDISSLSAIAVQMRNNFPSFGGIMLWDASEAYANNRYDQAIKEVLVAAGGTGFTYAACSAPDYASGTAYQAGSQVSYDGYIWQANYDASSTPTNDPNSEWSAISACAGGQSVSPSSTNTPTSSITPNTRSTSTRSSFTSITTSSSGVTRPSSSSSSNRHCSLVSMTTGISASPTANSGSCAGVAAWSNGIAYTAGQRVVFDNHLYTAKYWTENDTPGGKVKFYAALRQF